MHTASDETLAPPKGLEIAARADTITDQDVQKRFATMKEMRMLDSEDIANAVVYAVTQPDHVDVSEILVMPTAQG